MNAASLSMLGAVVAVAVAVALLFATGGLVLPVVAAALAVVLLVVGRRLRRAAETEGEDAEGDPRSDGPGEPLRNDTRAVFVGTGAPDDPLRSKTS